MDDDINPDDGCIDCICIYSCTLISIIGAVDAASEWYKMDMQIDVIK